MSDYIITCDEETASWIGNDVDFMKPIVRCRDCEYYHDGKNTDGKRYVEPHCLAIGELAYGAVFDVDESDFCSWAERREQ